MEVSRSRGAGTGLKENEENNERVESLVHTSAEHKQFFLCIDYFLKSFLGQVSLDFCNFYETGAIILPPEGHKLHFRAFGG